MGGCQGVAMQLLRCSGWVLGFDCVALQLPECCVCCYEVAGVFSFLFFYFCLAFCFAIARVTRLFLCGCLCRMSYAHSLIIEKLYQNISFKDVLVHAQEYVQYLMMACVESVVLPL